MADKVHPYTAKPLRPPPGAAKNNYPPLPQSHPPRRRHRNCCCCCLLFSTLVLFVLLILLAAAGGIFYAICRPKHPTFSVSAFQVSTFNITDSDQLISRIDLNLSTTNPSSKGFSYVYAPTSISATTGQISLGNGSFPEFVHRSGETKILSGVVKGDVRVSEGTAGDLRKRADLDVDVELRTRVGIKAGALKTTKIGVWVTCGGIRAQLPKGSAPASGVKSPSANCKVKIRVKIWKWYI